jgi:DNA-binding MarR family transcriptional regulator
VSNTNHTDFLANLTRTYHLLDAVSEQLHAGHGFSAGARAILLLLDRKGPMTMSEIARDRAVSRQLIQRLASALLDKGVIEAMPNVAHRKSAKLGLTPQGRSAVEGILLRESGIVAAVKESIEEIELQQTHAVLTKLNALLAQIRKVGSAKT